MYLQVLLRTIHVQVCTLDRCCEHQRTHLLHALYRMYAIDVDIYIYIYVHRHMYIERDNVVYWKTNRKINNGLRCN